MAGNNTTSQAAVAARQHHKPPIALLIVVCVFAIGAFLPTRALWIQLAGTLAATSSGHHQHLLVVCLLSNAVAVVYLVVSLCCCRRRSTSSAASSSTSHDAAAIYVAMTCGLASLCLLTISAGTSFIAAHIEHLLPTPTWTATTALLTAAGLGALAASLAAVTYVPFAGALDDVRSAGGNCICAVLIGDALSSLIPHVLALVQGVGSIPEFYSAANVTTPLPEVTDFVGMSVPGEPQGDADVFASGTDEGVRLRFSGGVYFLSCAGIACLASLCFVMLRCCCYRPAVYSAAKRSDDGGDNGVNTDTNTRHQDPATSTNQPLQASPSPLLPQPAPTSVDISSSPGQPKRTNLSPSTSRKEVACGSSAGHPSPQPTVVTTFLDDGTERQSSVSFREVEKPRQTVVDIKRASGRNQRRRATVVGSPQPDVEAPLTSSTPATGADVARNRRHVKPLRFRLKSVDVQPVSGGRPKLFRLLIVIVVWTSAVIGGPLSTVQSYACYPSGSRSFVAGAVVADAVAALACVVAARATPGRGDVSTVIAMTCLGTIVLVYYSALALFSLQPHLQQQLKARAAEMPLFGNTAEMLAAAAWVTVVGVFNFARARIGVECHVASAGALLVYACAARLGDVIGSTSLIGRISVCRIFDSPRH